MPHVEYWKLACYEQQDNEDRETCQSVRQTDRQTCQSDRQDNVSVTRTDRQFDTQTCCCSPSPAGVLAIIPRTRATASGENSLTPTITLWHSSLLQAKRAQLETDKVLALNVQSTSKATYHC